MSASRIKAALLKKKLRIAYGETSVKSLFGMTDATKYFPKNRKFFNYIYVEGEEITIQLDKSRVTIEENNMMNNLDLAVVRTQDIFDNIRKWRRRIILAALLAGAAALVWWWLAWAQSDPTLSRNSGEGEPAAAGEVQSSSFTRALAGQDSSWFKRSPEPARSWLGGKVRYSSMICPPS
jgi:hypothetical protein